jgi:hypothetical protein
MELTADDMITAIMIGLVLAMALTGVYAIARRKASESLTLMVGLMILASIASMALAFGHARYKQENLGFINQTQDSRRGPAGPHPDSPGHRGPPGGPEIGHFLAERLVGSADLDGDGRLSPEEAAKAAERLVREEVEGETGTIDVEALGRALNRRSGRPNHFGPGGPPGGSGPGAFRPVEIIAAVDEDADGRLSPEEVHQFVRSADTTGIGSLDARDLENTLKKRLGYRVDMAGPPAPARRSAPPVD